MEARYNMNNYFANTQEVDEWFMKRRSRFTSSENYKLLSSSNNEIFGSGAKTYIEAKVIELTTQMVERPQLDEVDSLRHGKMYEYPAFQRYIHETKNYSMSYLGDETPTFIPCKTIVDESGGTPDIVNIVDSSILKIDYGCEIKNSYNSAYHFRRLKWKDQWDIKQNYISCYTQIQDLIRLSGAFGWDFISYDERQLSKAAQVKIIEVKPDRKFIDNLELRILNAVKEKYKLLSEHMGVELKNRQDYLNFIKQ